MAFVDYWYSIWSAGWCQFRRTHSFYFCWWFITNDPWIVILISNKIRFSFSFWFIENDAISFIGSKASINWPWPIDIFVFVIRLKILSLVTRCLFLFLTCVCVFILFHLLVSSGCTTSLTYVRSSDQRSFVVSILLASAKFLHLCFWSYLISPPKTKTPATAYWRENDMISCAPRKDDIYRYRI